MVYKQLIMIKMLNFVRNWPKFSISKKVLLKKVIFVMFPSSKFDEIWASYQTYVETKSPKKS